RAAGGAGPGRGRGGGRAGRRRGRTAGRLRAGGGRGPHGQPGPRGRSAPQRRGSGRGRCGRTADLRGGLMDSGWTWSYEGYDPQAERLRESLCTLGNGYFATRGAATETLAGSSHYPGTYAAGCYNRLTS